MNVNKVILVGRLTRDPETRSTQSGQTVTTIGLATSHRWSDKSGQKQEKTEWHKIVVWGKLGENCNMYLAKGRQVYLEGKLATRSWDDKNGNKCYATEIIASVVQFIGDKGSSRDSSQPEGDQGFDQRTNYDEKEFKIDTNPAFAEDSIPF